MNCLFLIGKFCAASFFLSLAFLSPHFLFIRQQSRATIFSKFSILAILARCGRTPHFLSELPRFIFLVWFGFLFALARFCSFTCPRVLARFWLCLALLVFAFYPIGTPSFSVNFILLCTDGFSVLVQFSLCCRGGSRACRNWTSLVFYSQKLVKSTPLTVDEINDLKTSK